MTTIRYPAMRAEVVSAVAALADPDYQRRVWIDRQMPSPGYYDDLDANVHTLYDDTSVLEEPASTVGTVLVDETEAAAMQRLAAALDPLLAQLGDAPDRRYVDDPGWAAVVAAARAASQVLARHDLGA